MRAEQVGRRPECPEPDRWLAPDGYASEHDTSHFLASLVSLLKPDQVLETGTYRGHTARAIGWALAGLGRGRCVSLEIDPTRAEEARAACQGVPVAVVTGSSLTYEPERPIDLLFLDSEFELRAKELARFRRWASPRCVVAVHDTGNLDYPAAVAMLRELEWAAFEGIVRPWIFLPTPRGLGLTRYL